MMRVCVRECAFFLVGCFFFNSRQQPFSFDAVAPRDGERLWKRGSGNIRANNAGPPPHPMSCDRSTARGGRGSQRSRCYLSAVWPLSHRPIIFISCVLAGGLRTLARLTSAAPPLASRRPAAGSQAHRVHGETVA